jgi:hypothetical protein
LWPFGFNFWSYGIFYGPLVIFCVHMVYAIYFGPLVIFCVHVVNGIFFDPLVTCILCSYGTG